MYAQNPKPSSESPSFLIAVPTAFRRWFLAVLSESLPSRLLRRRRVPIVVAVLRPLQWANRLSSIRETLADRLLLCRLCLGDLYSLFVVKLFSGTGSWGNYEIPRDY